MKEIAWISRDWNMKNVGGDGENISRKLEKF